jgi:Sec-independent protein secretion pathway component TatC
MLTQTIFAAPMIALYLASILIAWIVGPKREKAAAGTSS